MGLGLGLGLGEGYGEQAVQGGREAQVALGVVRGQLDQHVDRARDDGGVGVVELLAQPREDLPQGEG